MFTSPLNSEINLSSSGNCLSKMFSDINYSTGIFKPPICAVADLIFWLCSCARPMWFSILHFVIVLLVNNSNSVFLFFYEFRSPPSMFWCLWCTLPRFLQSFWKMVFNIALIDCLSAKGLEYNYVFHMVAACALCEESLTHRWYVKN